MEVWLTASRLLVWWKRNRGRNAADLPAKVAEIRKTASTFTRYDSWIRFSTWLHQRYQSILYQVRRTPHPRLKVLILVFHADLKNTTDDALPNYLNSLNFKQSHFFADVRLGLGYTAVVIAAVTFYADYKLGWDATKQGTFWAVIGYFILNSALTYWIWAVEKGKVFVGERDNGASVGKPMSILNLHC